MMPGRLEEADVLSRRFDLVKKMYLSDKVIAANKKDLIFNWFLEQFGNTDKDKKSRAINELLWKTFQDILMIEKQSSSCHRILIKSNVITNLLNAVANYSVSNSWGSVILTSVVLFLETPTVNSTLISDTKTLYLLLIAAVKVICKVYDDRKSLKEAINLCNAVLNILENLASSNEEERIFLLSGSLQDLALFFYISKSDQELDNLCERLSKRIISMVFNFKSKQYETLLTPVDASVSTERPNTSILQFLSSLHNMLMNEDIIIDLVTVNEACAALMKKLLTVFLHCNKFNLHSYKILSLFFAVAGLDIPMVMGARTCCHSLFKEQISDSEVLIVGLSSVLEACSSVPRYFISLPVQGGYLKFSEWLQGVSAALLDAKLNKYKSLWLQCFHSLVIISPPIIEYDIQPLIKTALLNVNVRSTESKKRYYELFDAILAAHSKLYQVPRFFVKLLLCITECIKEDGGGKLLVNGQILPPVQESVARCVQALPHGQMVDVWNIFLETFSTLENMCEVFSVSKGFIFYVAQMFATFLLHAQLFQANIPVNIASQFPSLIKKTSDEIEKNVNSLRKRGSKVSPLQKSVLLLSHCIGEVKLAYLAYSSESFKNGEVMVKDTYDFSLLHPFLDETYVPDLKSLYSSDPLLSVLIFQLLLQKIKALQFKELVSDEDKVQMKELTSVVLSSLREASGSCCDAWDSDFCTVSTKNYSTAFWKMFFKVSPLILNHLDFKDVYDLCNTMQSVILTDNSSDGGAKSAILDFLNSDFFHESLPFQTAFVSAIWKQEKLLCSKKRSHDDMITGESSVDKIFVLLNAYHSKALKYAKRTPKSDKNLGSIWNEIKEITDILNEILQSQTMPKYKLIIHSTQDFIKLLNSLPLEYLLPGNQMKCLAGLSMLFFLLPKSEEAVSLGKEISSALLSIFEGVRSIWLFDFVASGPYMKWVEKTLKSVCTVGNCENSEWAVYLIERLTSLLVKTSDSLSAVEQYIIELGEDSKCAGTTLMVYCALLKKFSQVISYPYKQEQLYKVLVRVSSIASRGFMNQMKMNFKEGIEDSDHAYFIKGFIYVIEIICNSPEVAKKNSECFEPLPSVLELVLSRITCSSNDLLSSTYLLFISKICKHVSKLPQVLSENFISILWKIIFSYFEDKKKEASISVGIPESASTEANVSGSSSCRFCSGHSNKQMQLTDPKSESQTTGETNNNILSPIAFSKFEEESLKQLSLVTSSETLAKVFEEIIKELGKPQADMFSTQVSILIFQNLIDADNAKCQDPLLNQLIQRFMNQLSLIANQACRSTVCQLMVMSPALNFMSFIVKTKILPKQVLLQSLHCVAPVPLDSFKDDYALFVKLFAAAWGHVYNLFIHHPSLILPFPAPFLSYVSKLLKSIVSAGAADSISKCDSSTLQQLHLCAQNMNRLLTVIARHKLEFSKLAPYLVADYVDTVQHITLDSNIKESLLSGIHRLLNICSEDSIKMLSININDVCIEIYKNLVKDYKQNRQITAS